MIVINLNKQMMFLKIVLVVLGVIVALALAVLLFGLYLDFKAKGRRKAWLSTHKPVVLTEERKRLLTFGAIMAGYRNEEVFDLVFDKEVEVYAKGLANQWEVSNREEALEGIRQVLGMTRSYQFDASLGVNADTSEANTLYAEVAKALELDEAKVKAVRTTYAWDMCRVVALSKWCYWLDYITEEEMWSFMEQAADKASKLGKDWEEYTISFLLGRAIHGFGVEDIQYSCTRLLSGEDDLYSRYSFH